MVQFFTITLFVSVAALTLILTLKQVELSTGKVILAPVRPQINRFFKTCLVLVERVLPSLAQEGYLALFKKAREAVKVVLARAVLSVETKLHTALVYIREKFNPEPRRGEASAFLKEVGEYKKQLAEDVAEEVTEDQTLY